MALKLPQLILILLRFSLFFLLFHEFHRFKYSKIINDKHIATNMSHSSSSLSPHPLISSRKVLASKFDFTPFVKQHQRRHDDQQHGHHQKRSAKAQQEPAGESEIDPRYGVEKRHVPTGPNPLHH
ncbi:hypothetical protein F2P56_011842 [Juglans regia]|uniref:CLAVATA3/ESR (CLE)-related protein 12-like n=2 Tax=Juglans regia TaxID=51240 RepID=A0A833XKI9_JUGRE|nr:CLAVATA3/ESR (CLE)-related protein 12-like [Juglans regia]KAF5467609.1 hypothetical protein F2P56_011842 [Juglans regia]